MIKFDSHFKTKKLTLNSDLLTLKFLNSKINYERTFNIGFLYMNLHLMMILMENLDEM